MNISDPELAELRLIQEKLAQDEALYDLTPEQIMFVSIIRAINSKFPIPLIVAFVDNFVKLSPSRDRLGRQELVATLKRTIQYAKVEKNQPFMVEEVQKREQESFILRYKNVIFGIIAIIALYLLMGAGH